MNIQIADFGASLSKNVDQVSDLRGTLCYMAPEIHEGKVYNGK